MARDPATLVVAGAAVPLASSSHDMANVMETLRVVALQQVTALENVVQMQGLFGKHDKLLADMASDIARHDKSLANLASDVGQMSTRTKELEGIHDKLFASEQIAKRIQELEGWRYHLTFGAVASADGSGEMEYLKPGDKVILQGLRAAELNGKKGVVSEFLEESDRHAVRLEGSSQPVSIRSMNLRKLAP